MKPLAFTIDHKINATNFLLEFTTEEYLTLAEPAIKRNVLQRGRVDSAASVYGLLKKDFEDGCVLPSIVLAIADQGKAAPKELKAIVSYVNTNQKKVVILDGLQRTYTLLDLRDSIKESKSHQRLNAFNKRTLRIEVYVGINRLGILYRMLTLNTGQTPMTLRQQVEMLYSDYLTNAPNGIHLIKEVDDEAPKKLGEYNFHSAIEGFNSYLERNELPIDRFDILDGVKSLEKLSEEKNSKNLFDDFLLSYQAILSKFDSMVGRREFKAQSLGIVGQLFGKDVRRAFSKSQALSGFGSAVGKLKDHGAIKELSEVGLVAAKLKGQRVPADDFILLLKTLEQIRLTSKKIGNAQRLYFHYYFRELLNPNSDSYANLTLAAQNAYKKYQVEMS